MDHYEMGQAVYRAIKQEADTLRLENEFLSLRLNDTQFQANTLANCLSSLLDGFPTQNDIDNFRTIYETWRTSNNVYQSN